jgi:hypothetical protein
MTEIEGIGYFTEPILDSNRLIGKIFGLQSVPYLYTELQTIVPVQFKAYLRIGIDYLPALEYRVIRGTLPESLVLNKTSGILSGTLGEMDKYIPEYIEQTRNRQINHVNYGKYGSASLFENGIGITKKVYFTIRASRNNLYTDEEFGIGIKNNWSSDRDEIVKEYSNGLCENSTST